jgi:acetyltransferase-like isoleucine patch superfamily enzyme
VGTQRTLPWDWYPGTIPDNVELDETAYIETTYSFMPCRSTVPVAVKLGRGASAYNDTVFDLGPQGRVRFGDYTLAVGVRIICDAEVEVGDYTMMSWNVVLMDTYRLSFDPHRRRQELERFATCEPRRFDAAAPAQPIHIGANVWIGFDVCVLPGVTIGEGAIIGARSVVKDNVAPYAIVAGNPTRVIRYLDTQEPSHGNRKTPSAR